MFTEETKGEELQEAQQSGSRWDIHAAGGFSVFTALNQIFMASARDGGGQVR